MNQMLRSGKVFTKQEAFIFDSTLGNLKSWR